MLAHKAEDEGVAVAERIAGQHGHVDFNTVPWVIYTSPEIAWVGQTEQQLKAAGVAYRAGIVSVHRQRPRAGRWATPRGFVKFLADAKTDRILGMHAIGPMVSELIAEGVVAMEFGASSEDIARICHAHPSLSEAVQRSGAGGRQAHPQHLSAGARTGSVVNDAIAPTTRRAVTARCTRGWRRSSRGARWCSTRRRRPRSRGCSGCTTS